MKPKLLLRLASGCLLFFALGHTMGHVSRHNIKDENAQKVLAAMAGYKYNMFGQLRTYDENYTGMSLNLIITLLVLGFLLWVLSIEVNNLRRPGLVLIPLALCALGFAITSWLYFFPVPATSCFLAFLLILYTAIRQPKEGVV